MIPVFLLLLSISQFVCEGISFLGLRFYWWDPVPTPGQVYHSIITVFDDFGIYRRFLILLIFFQHYVLSGVIFPLLISFYLIDRYFPETFRNGFFVYPQLFFYGIAFPYIHYQKFYILYPKSFLTIEIFILLLFLLYFRFKKGDSLSDS